ncbi:MAG: fluoride efflux transporter CrcB [Actinomycetota bacterium]
MSIGSRLSTAGLGRRSSPSRHRRAPVDVLGTIAAGGALGSPARFGIAQLIKVAPGSFPWATFWTNISGSFALGFILLLIIERFPPSRYLRPFFAIGFLGAYTTYSTFAVETMLLGKAGHTATAAAYALGSLLAGFLAVWIGIMLARVFPIRDKFTKGVHG